MLANITKGKSLVRIFCTNKLPQREKMEYDVLIVGGGVAGLSAAIKIKQLEAEYQRPLSVCVIQKGTEVGDHILSGNCFEPRAFDELYPKWRSMDKETRPPIDTPVTEDKFMIFPNQKYGIKVPNMFLPSTINNHGNYIISLSKLTRWMGDQATELGVDIFPGTPGSQVLYDDQESVCGVATGDFGISKEGELRQNFQRGIQIIAKQTVFSEGCRGSLTEKVIQKYNLRKDCDPPLYGIGLKEVWEVDDKNFKPGMIQHSVGWPVNSDVYAGSFLYTMKPNIVHVGLVVGLNYKNPYLNPYQEFQKMKLHPDMKKYLKGGQCISYGARALNSQGYFSIPQLVFPGGVLAGCSAGFMNVMKIKGSHNAMKSGIQAGKAIFQKLTTSEKNGQHPKRAEKYELNMKKSWVFEELHQTRNFKNSFKSLYSGLAYSGMFFFLRGKQPFDIRNKIRDSERTEPASKHKPIDYPKPDRKLTFDLLDNLARSGTNHDHNQPSHLVIKQSKQNMPAVSLTEYGAPQERFCPAKVYQFIDDGKGGKKLQINAQNCLHCKTCSIKMINEYIDWRTPEGNGGPKYNLM